MKQITKFTSLFCILTFISIVLSQAPPKILYIDRVDLDSVSKSDATRFVLNNYQDYAAEYLTFTLFPIDPQPPALPGNISFCLGSSNEIVDDLGCNDISKQEETVILPPQTGLLQSIYVTVKTTNEEPLQFTLSVSIILDALSDTFLKPSGKYLITGSVSSGIRQYYRYNPISSDQQIQIEVCNSMDYSGNNNAVSGSFLFNRTSDHWAEYNQTLYDNPCGLSGTHGIVKVFDPTGDTHSLLKICPTYVITAGPLPDNTFFAIDVLQFWDFPMLNGTVSYAINIDTTYSTVVPLVPAGQGNPSYIMVADFTVTKSGSDAVVSFATVRTSSGPPPTDIQYALFTDFDFSEQVKQYLISNSSLSSSCFLLAHEDDMMIGNWVPTSNLQSAGASDVSFTIADFYDTYSSGGTFHVNLVAYSPSGSFAYTYLTITTDDSGSGLGGWAITFIVLGSIAGAIAIVLVLGVIGYFAIMKYQNRSKYELL